MYILFDIGRLMIDDEKKLHAFHNEIARLCNETYERVRKDVEESDQDERESFKAHFGFQQRYLENEKIFEPCVSLYSGLEELISFMYSDSETYRTKINGFLVRAQNGIDFQYNLHYK